MSGLLLALKKKLTLNPRQVGAQGTHLEGAGRTRWVESSRKLPSLATHWRQISILIVPSTDIQMKRENHLERLYDNAAAKYGAYWGDPTLATDWTEIRPGGGFRPKPKRGWSYGVRLCVYFTAGLRVRQSKRCGLHKTLFFFFGRRCRKAAWGHISSFIIKRRWPSLFS